MDITTSTHAGTAFGLGRCTARARRRWAAAAAGAVIAVPLALGVTGVAQADTASADHSQGNASTTGSYASPQPLSRADSNDAGANDTSAANPYRSTRQGALSLNGQGDGAATGQPCAGCVGRADNKNPAGQAPDGTDPNAGYECDRNSGIGRTNPAHTGCRALIAALVGVVTPTPSPTGSGGPDAPAPPCIGSRCGGGTTVTTTSETSGTTGGTAAAPVDQSSGSSGGGVAVPLTPPVGTTATTSSGGTSTGGTPTGGTSGGAASGGAVPAPGDAPALPFTGVPALSLLLLSALLMLGGRAALRAGRPVAAGSD